MSTTDHAVRPVPQILVHEVHRPRTSRRWIDWVLTTDHKRIGIMYLVLTFVFFLMGGVEALMIRVQLAIPNNNFVTPQLYDRLFTIHGTRMVFLVGMPILFGFGTYIVPLQIGARDMAFPRLNAFSFWMTAFGGLLMYYSYIGGFGLYGVGTAPDFGWFAYAPLTSLAFSRGRAPDYWAIALIVVAVLAARGVLPAHERWWVWTCTAGFGLGMWGLWFVPILKRYRAREAERRAQLSGEPSSTSRESGPKTGSSTDTPGSPTRS